MAMKNKPSWVSLTRGSVAIFWELKISMRSLDFRVFSLIQCFSHQSWVYATKNRSSHANHCLSTVNHYVGVFRDDHINKIVLVQFSKISLSFSRCLCQNLAVKGYLVNNWNSRQRDPYVVPIESKCFNKSLEPSCQPMWSFRLHLNTSLDCRPFRTIKNKNRNDGKFRKSTKAIKENPQGWIFTTTGSGPTFVHDCNLRLVHPYTTQMNCKCDEQRNINKKMRAN